MKMNLSASIFSLLFIALFFLGCKKEVTDLKEEQNMKTTAAKSEASGGCQLTKWSAYDELNDFETIDKATFKNGLVDEWTPFYEYIYKMEYGVNGKMTLARGYYDGQLIYTIHFIYKNNKVVKELWYVGNTQNIEDEVTNTYNERGQLIKSQSIFFDYIVLNKYNIQGNLESWEYILAGLLNVKGEYTYKEEIKNPFNSARPGISYNFAFSNSAFITGKRWFSSEKITVYDENGNPFVIYDQDPDKTKWVHGPQNNPLRADCVDAIAGGSTIHSFEYQNCMGNESVNLMGPLQQKTGVNKNKMNVGKIKPLLHGPTKELIQKLKELRK